MDYLAKMRERLARAEALEHEIDLIEAEVDRKIRSRRESIRLYQAQVALKDDLVYRNRVNKRDLNMRWAQLYALVLQTEGFLGGH